MLPDIVTFIARPLSGDAVLLHFFSRLALPA